MFKVIEMPRAVCFLQYNVVVVAMLAHNDGVCLVGVCLVTAHTETKHA